MENPLSAELQSRIGALRESALRLREEMTDQGFKDEISRVLADVDEIPRLFKSEEAMHQALLRAEACVREVAAIKAKRGTGAQRFPGASDRR